jgi:hypothetical protein
VETGSRQENASAQESRAPLRFYRSGKGSSVLNPCAFAAEARARVRESRFPMYRGPPVQQSARYRRRAACSRSAQASRTEQTKPAPRRAAIGGANDSDGLNRRQRANCAGFDGEKCLAASFIDDGIARAKTFIGEIAFVSRQVTAFNAIVPAGGQAVLRQDALPGLVHFVPAAKKILQQKGLIGFGGRSISNGVVARLTSGKKLRCDTSIAQPEERAIDLDAIRLGVASLSCAGNKIYRVLYLIEY